MTLLGTERKRGRRLAVLLMTGILAISAGIVVSHAESGVYPFESAKANYTAFENTFTDGTVETFDQPTFKNPGIPGTPYCIEPKVWFIKGDKQQMDFAKYMKEKRNLTFTQEQITHLALGVDYIENQMADSGNFNRNILAQAYLWLKLPAPDGATIVKMKVGGDADIAKRIEKEADAYADANAGRAIGTGYAYYANGGQTMGSFTVTYFGGVRLKKAPANPTLAGFSDLYSLKGAVYQVLREDGTEAGRLTTSDSGETNVLEVEPGTYKVKEIESPQGYLLDPNTYTVEVSAEKTAEVSVVEKPVMVPADLLLKKLDAETAMPIADAEYTIRYYSGEEAVGVPYSIWVFRSDENGEIHLTKEDYIRGDALFSDEEGQIVLPLGCYTVQETKAPAGYRLDDTIYERSLLFGVEKETELLWNPVESLEEEIPEIPKAPKEKTTIPSVNTGDEGLSAYDPIIFILALGLLAGVLFVKRRYSK